MKKIMIPVVVLTLCVSSILPSVHVRAEENVSIEKLRDVSVDERITNLMESDFDYDISKNEKTGVNTIELTYEGKESVAIYDENSGEVVVDGELVAIIHKDEQVISENEEIFSDMIQPYAAGVKTYNIGDPKLGSGTYVSKYRDSGTFSLLAGTASVVTMAAVMVSLFSGVKKPAKNNAQILAAAASLLTVVTSVKTTYDWHFMHTKDKHKKAFYMDTLTVKRAVGGTTHRISHYHGRIS